MAKLINPQPECRKCGERIEYRGRGRPPTICRGCDPKRWEKNERRAAKRASAEMAEV